jgi:DNA-binding beta-propeller fold protein YncE
MKPAQRTLLGLTLLSAAYPLATGCQSTPSGPVLAPRLNAPVWPAAPDTPRIRYIGELNGEESLGRKKSGLQLLRETIAGPTPQASFTRPGAVAVTGDLVFVADPGSRVVHRLDLASRSYTAITNINTAPIGEPVDLEIARQNLYVVDRRNGSIEVFDLSGNHQKTLNHPALTAPVGIAYDATRDLLWISDVNSHQLFTLNATNQLAPTFGRRGTQPGAFNYPTGLAWHQTTGLAIVDALNFRVQIIDPGGSVQAIIGEAGDAAGSFSRPRDVAFDAAGNLYVLDNQFENVQIFNPTGQLLMAFGSGGSDAAGRFSVPAGITIDQQDRIWIADSYHERVQVFQILGDAS